MPDRPEDHVDSTGRGLDQASSRAVRVALRGVSKYFGKAKVLSDIDLEVSQGEFCVLLGPSGCGKSTLLRIIAGLESPSTGRILINDADVTSTPPGDRDVAMVFQSYAIYPHMTVFENIAFPLKLRKLPKDEIKSKVQGAAALLQLTDLLERKPAQLSGGQRQRVAMGRAIVRNPMVFLFDEPLSNLDAKLRVTMRIEIAQLHRKLAATIIYVTHDQIEAMTLADRIVVLDRGAIQQIDTPQGLYNHPANLMVAEFVGTPSMNLIRGTVRAVGANERPIFHSQAFTMQLVESTCEGEVTLGIRPEHISINPAGPISGHVQFVEDMGAEKYAHVELVGEEKVVVRMPATLDLRMDDKVSLSIEVAHVHVFPQE